MQEIGKYFVGSLLVGGLGLLIFCLLGQQKQELLRDKERRLLIGESLINFWGPFSSKLELATHLYRALAKDKPTEFRALLAILAGTTFKPNDRVLLLEVVRLDGELEAIISGQVGRVQNAFLRKLLYRAAAHFHVIQLAAKGGLNGDIERFADYLYPRELNEHVDSEITRLWSQI